MSAVRILQAVRFSGSTTQVNAINHWMKTGEYHRPFIVTADLRLTFITEVGQLKVNNGDYVVKHENGTFSVKSPEEFGLL